MAAAGAAAPGRPVDDDEAQTHYHKQEANPSEDGSLGDTDRVIFRVFSRRFYPKRLTRSTFAQDKQYIPVGTVRMFIEPSAKQ